MNLRRDHVAGGAFVGGGALVLALSGDLPFGTLGSPGAGMMPKLVIAFLILFGAILFVRAGESPSLASIEWADIRHALPVLAVAAAAATVYTMLGFLLTIPLLLFLLVYIVERQPLLPALAFSVGTTALAYGLFGVLLRTGLPRGLWGF
jgi:putative tricarboxylic transport membrane protein